MTDQDLLVRLRLRLAAIKFDIERLIVERDDLLCLLDSLEEKEGPVNDSVSGS